MTTTVNHTSTSFSKRLLGSGLITQSDLQQCVESVGEDDALLAQELVERGLLTRFQARQVRAGATSLSVGKYIVLDCVGRGANGIVFKAKHALLPDRVVALKTIDTTSLHRSEEVLARFRRETEIVARLDHPNVVRAIDVIQTRTHLYLVLEFIEGRNLGEVVEQRGPLPITEAVDYGVQAACGLAYAHHHGIVHRDVKPTNLLLTNEGIVKLADLGLARFFSEEQNADLTLKGLAIGTPEFMAPEQAEDAATAGPKSDLYSLGATLFHLLTAKLPIRGSSYFHKIKELLTAPPRPLAEVRPDVPLGLAQVVDQLRARSPEDRPASADETIELLKPYAVPRNRSNSSANLDPDRLGKFILSLLKGQTDSHSVSTRTGLTEAEVDEALERFVEGGKQALHPEASNGISFAQLQRLHAKIGQQAVEIETLKAELEDLRS
ncbi:MAG: serine/threonine-protein kinase [Gemmataceae bacterium]